VLDDLVSPCKLVFQARNPGAQRPMMPYAARVLARGVAGLHRSQPLFVAHAYDVTQLVVLARLPF